MYFTLWKSRVKKLQHFKQGDAWCKMAVAGLHSLAKLHAQMCIADRGNPQCLDRGLHRTKWPYCWLPQTVVQFESGLPQAWTDRMYSIDCYLSAELGNPQSTWERPRGYSCFGEPRYLSAELSDSEWVNSSTRHFRSTVPLFIAT
jgi:hypothetical protein